MVSHPGSEQLPDYVGENIRRLRIRRELTQLQLAAKLDLSVRMVKRIEGGLVDCRIRLLANFAHALGTTPGALLRAVQFETLKRGRPRRAKAEHVGGASAVRLRLR